MTMVFCVSHSDYSHTWVSVRSSTTTTQRTSDTYFSGFTFLRSCISFCVYSTVALRRHRPPARFNTTSHSCHDCNYYVAQLWHHLSHSGPHNWIRFPQSGFPTFHATLAWRTHFYQTIIHIIECKTCAAIYWWNRTKLTGFFFNSVQQAFCSINEVNSILLLNDRPIR